VVLENFDVLRLKSAVDGRWDGVDIDQLSWAIQATRDIERSQGELEASLRAEFAIGRLERELEKVRKERDKLRARCQIDAREQRYQREGRSKVDPLRVLLDRELSRLFVDRTSSEEEFSDEIMRLMKLQLAEFYRPPE
jgi:uncharacterized membrane protein